MEVAEARRLRALEDENARLKRVVADQAVQIQILKEVNAKKMVSSSSRRRAVKQMVEEGLGSAAQACRALGLARSSFYLFIWRVWLVKNAIRCRLRLSI
jgi:putative transposase